MSCSKWNRFEEYWQLQFSIVFDSSVIQLHGHLYRRTTQEDSCSPELSRFPRMRCRMWRVRRLAAIHTSKTSRLWMCVTVLLKETLRCSNVLFWSARYRRFKRLTRQTHRHWWCTEPPLKVLHFPVLHFPALQSRPPNFSPAFSCLCIFSTPTESASMKSVVFALDHRQVMTAY